MNGIAVGGFPPTVRFISAHLATAARKYQYKNKRNIMNFDPLTSASPAILIHLVAAVLALIFGTIMWLRPKGTKSHKFTGRAFIVLLLLTAITAIFIREINRGQFSFIHIFVIVTFVGVVQSLQAIKNGNIKKHVKHVKGMFFGALLIPGLLSFLPGRRLFAVFFGG